MAVAKPASTAARTGVLARNVQLLVLRANAPPSRSAPTGKVIVAVTLVCVKVVEVADVVLEEVFVELDVELVVVELYDEVALVMV